MSAPVIDLSFPHHWQAEILAARPLILPPRHFVYPREAEEVERGALEVLVRPRPMKRDPFSNDETPGSAGAKAPVDFGATAGLKSCPVTKPVSQGVLPQPVNSRPAAPGSFVGACPVPEETAGHQPFLATCALGFRDPAVPTGLWSTPEPEKICALSGGYAYIIDTTNPETFNMIPYRPVLQVRPVFDAELLLFVGHHSILAWGGDGHAWQSAKLSDEGVTITAIANGELRGLGWDMMSDRETPFALDLRNGQRLT